MLQDINVRKEGFIYIGIMIIAFLLFCFIETAINKFLWNVIVHDLFNGPETGWIGAFAITIVLSSGILSLRIKK